MWIKKMEGGRLLCLCENLGRDAHDKPLPADYAYQTDQFQDQTEFVLLCIRSERTARSDNRNATIIIVFVLFLLS